MFSLAKEKQEMSNEIIREFLREFKITFKLFNKDFGDRIKINFDKGKTEITDNKTGIIIFSLKFELTRRGGKVLGHFIGNKIDLKKYKEGINVYNYVAGGDYE